MCCTSVIHMVASQDWCTIISYDVISRLCSIVIIESSENVSVCVVMWPGGSDRIGSATWFKDTNGESGHITTNDVNGYSAPTNITNTLM